MAYKITMGQLAAQGVKDKETAIPKLTIQEAKTRLAHMNLVDQFLFDEVMEYQDAFQATVSILMGKEITFLSKGETEKEFRVSPELRQSRLDSVAMDKNHVIYKGKILKSFPGSF